MSSGGVAKDDGMSSGCESVEGYAGVYVYGVVDSSYEALYE